MKLIPLNKGYSAMVDDEDYDALIKLKWQANICKKTIYAYGGKRDKETGKTIKLIMHRIIMNAPSRMDVDHIDHNG